MINNEEYWNNIFKKEKNDNKREMQTSFFGNLAISNLPRWIIEDIEFNSMIICDVGCAEGDATYLLSNEFKNNKVIGIDFSSEAIKIARDKYHDICFEVGDIRNINEQYDVTFSSNMLEHFYNYKDILEKLIKISNKYCILLLPFREYYTIKEHHTYFDFQSFPFEFEDYMVCYFKVMTMQGEDVNYWFGEQILIVYAKKDNLKTKNISLRNFYNGYIEERTKIIMDYDEKINSLNKKLLEADNNFKKESQDKNEIKSELLKSKDIITETQCKIDNQLIEISNLVNILGHTNHELVDAKEQLTNIVKDKEILNENNKILLSENSELKGLINNLYLEKENINSAINNIIITQNSKSYKLSLLFKRFLSQFIKGNEKKDFIKWLFGRLSKKYMGSKWLKEFDHLEIAKLALNRESTFDINSITYKMEKNIKNSRQVFIFASVPYYDVGGGQRSAQLAKTFNNMGYEVYYIYGFHSSETEIKEMFIPAIMHEHIDKINIQDIKDILKKEAIFIFEIPYESFEPYLDFAQKYNCYTIYEHIDNWGTSLGCLFYNETVFKRFLLKADLLTVTARLLGEKLKEQTNNSYIYSANAVNSELFEPLKEYNQPKDLIKGKNKTLLYFGSLWGEWFDWEKIEYISQKCKDCEINLIGDYGPIQDKVKKMEKNVHFLGIKNQAELPAYLMYSDIALLPFKNCEIGKYVSPLKIFEYIAMNKLVLSTPLDDIKGYPNTICTDDKEEWVKVIYSEYKIVDSNSFILNNNWYARCNQLLDKASSKEIVEESISVIVLNHNNKKVIGRCVNSLLNHIKRYNYEIVIVDNNSHDGSYEYLDENFGNTIKLIKNELNGCSSGRNIGVKNSTGKYICFLDSDQWVISDRWLDTAINILKNELFIGAVSWNAGWFEPGKTTGPIVDYQPNRAIDSSKILYRNDIAYLATSGMVLERKLFEEIGGFDEYYDPTCFEDTDISLKVRHAGYELAYCPYMSIMHLPHQTTQSGSSGHSKLMERNGKYFIDKWTKIDKNLLEYYL
ncbi:glycosyltransferase [Anaerocolumna sedimenticola]|uniref:Glycosyltransferase n=1 Tax=Anaerocolumna sedimenticola TaxID=2696063 RepID=A0A6P1TIN5_9FIRM|nr:glycosyltransferase [Anaerocolumna sedimenticola]QHQ61060.1 glycosyltransferase [Anaerocolumna sedimenticola]